MFGGMGKSSSILLVFASILFYKSKSCNLQLHKVTLLHTTFRVFFLGIIFWKEATLFDGGRGWFSDDRASFLSGGGGGTSFVFQLRGYPMGVHWF